MQQKIQNLHDHTQWSLKKTTGFLKDSLLEIQNCFGLMKR